MFFSVMGDQFQREIIRIDALQNLADPGREERPVGVNSEDVFQNILHFPEIAALRRLPRPAQVLTKRSAERLMEMDAAYRRLFSDTVQHGVKIIHRLVRCPQRKIRVHQMAHVQHESGFGIINAG